MLEPRDFIRTKIIATVGPASSEMDVLVRMIEAGARVFRLNFSHGKLDEHAVTLNNIRAAAEQAGVPIAALGDLSGPKLRVGEVAGDGIELAMGDTVEFVREPVTATRPTAADAPVRFSLTQPDLIDDVAEGHRVLIDDGAVRLLAVDCDGARLRCVVTVGGRVTTRKGVNLPDSHLRVPSMTDHDWRCVDWAASHELDFLALSFVRSADDVRTLKAALVERAAPGAVPIPVISKIEKPQAIEDIDAILDASDGVMVARGDLGVEMELTEVPLIQKRVIELAREHGRPVIVATQMLQSMIDTPSPTRAEVSDVANAILDGADAVMLSGETAVGKYPVVAVRMMGKIATRIEEASRSGLLRIDPPPMLRDSRYRTAALAHGVSTVVRDLGAVLVIVWSQRGGGARYLSLHRPGVPVIAASSSDVALRRMSMLYAVCPVKLAQPTSVEAFVESIDRMLLDDGWAQKGDAVIVVTGEPIGAVGVTNKLRIHYVGESDAPRQT